MCKANGKLWNNYWQTDRATNYLMALSTDTGKPVTGPTGLVISVRGGEAEAHGFMSGSLLISLDGCLHNLRLDGRLVFGASVPSADTQPVLAPTVLDTVDRSIQLLERLGGVDERAQMLLRDVVLNTAMKSAGGTVPALEPAKELTLSEKLIELGCPSHKATAVATKIGKQVKAVYKNENGRDPKTQDQLVGGRRCAVACYEQDFLRAHERELQEAINHFCA